MPRTPIWTPTLGPSPDAIPAIHIDDFSSQAACPSGDPRPPSLGSNDRSMGSCRLFLFRAPSIHPHTPGKTGSMIHECVRASSHRVPWGVPPNLGKVSPPVGPVTSFRGILARIRGTRRFSCNRSASESHSPRVRVPPNPAAAADPDKIATSFVSWYPGLCGAVAAPGRTTVGGAT
jgi:hypothetical protein